MRPLIKPNFFIVGAAKCGTTALYVYLKAHPRVFLSPVKEPRYFAEDMPNLMNRVAARDDYLRLFKGANDRHIAVGEASPQYLYSAVAPAKIRAFNPDARIIAMLRNPVDMAWAAHAECLYWFVEEEPDFEKAWRLQGERRAGRCVPPLCKQVTMLLGAEVAMLGAQVERLLAVFPRDQVKFVLFEDFTGRTREVYEEVLAFLGVPSDGRSVFPKINTTKRHRLRSLGRLLIHPPKPLGATRTFLERRLGFYRLWPALRRLNSAPAKRAPMSPAFRAELMEFFRADVEKLGCLIGRDLSGWHR